MPMARPLPQFPQPTRPAFSYDIDPVPFPVLPEQEYHHPESLSVPKPEFCSESRDAESEIPVQCTGTSDPDDTNLSISLSPPTGKTPKSEKEAVDELLRILVECMEELNTRSRETLLRKFFSEIEREEQLEQFIVERLKQSRVKAISELCDKLPKKESDDHDSKFSDAEAEPPVLTSIVRQVKEQETERYTSDREAVITRSISESVEELSQKLERFKVKTLDLGGAVVKEEESKK